MKIKITKTMRRLALAAAISLSGFAFTLIWYKLSERIDDGGHSSKRIARLVNTVNEVQKKQIQYMLFFN